MAILSALGRMDQTGKDPVATALSRARWKNGALQSGLVRQVVVVAQADSHTNKRLVGYYVVAGEGIDQRRPYNLICKAGCPVYDPRCMGGVGDFALNAQWQD